MLKISIYLFFVNFFIKLRTVIRGKIIRKNYKKKKMMRSKINYRKGSESNAINFQLRKKNNTVTPERIGMQLKIVIKEFLITDTYLNCSFLQ